jgi:hypothetical protein
MDGRPLWDNIIRIFLDFLSLMDNFMHNVTPTFTLGLMIGFMGGGAIFSAIVTVSWVRYGERRCKECGKDPGFDENEEKEL